MSGSCNCLIFLNIFIAYRESMKLIPVLTVKTHNKSLVTTEPAG